MSPFRVSRTGRVNAPANTVYRLIADYHNGHPRIVPPEYFFNLVVEEGGYGAGTWIAFDARMLGMTQHARGWIEEPEPGVYPAELARIEHVAREMGSGTISRDGGRASRA